MIVEWLAPTVRILFFVCLAWVVLSAAMKRGQGGRRSPDSHPHRVLLVFIALAMGGVLFYQATWQLAGFRSPEFVAFMKRYNRRPDNPAARFERGRILDRDGVVLAADRVGSPGIREYPGAETFCHVIGYHHPVYGLSGAEAAGHAVLSGLTVSTRTEREQFGRNVLRREGLRGHDAVLTLSAPLQIEAHAHMAGRKGAAVFLDPRDGSVLVLYSSPGFDPNRLRPELFASRDPDARLMNRATRGLYPPGSSFKILTALAAWDAGLDPVYPCPPEGFVTGSGNRPIRDHEYYAYSREGRVWHGHGHLNMRDALAKSSNVYFARLGAELGGPALREAADRAGWTGSWSLFEGASSTLSAVSGQFPLLRETERMKTAHTAIGQGEVLVAPLHMAVLAGAIGRGEMMRPRLLASSAPVALDRPFSAAGARAVSLMMRHTVTHGTGRTADIPGLSVAGKTGTAQQTGGAAHGWFVGFAPAENPRIAFAVVVERGGYGSLSALPIATGVLTRALEMGLLAEGAASPRGDP